MPNIQKVELQTQTINGLKIRTKNADEMNLETQKIAPLWEKFFTEVMPKLEPSPPPLYGVYSQYESDALGAYDLLVGTEGLEGSEFTSVSIKEGSYLVFSVRGELPKSILEVWGQIWAYFEDPSVDERRAYETDFERYISKDEAEIYIGVHYL
ncbi:MAG: GyrI-like domain-containing protein [Sulfurovum sp.]|nr:GyrI-like domain-containing protein [Sulfurovum sp.]